MSAPAELLPDVMTDQGTIATDRLARVLHINKAELANATGLSRDAVSKRDRLSSRKTQTRLRDTVEIIHRAAKWTGSVGHAFAWFRAHNPRWTYAPTSGKGAARHGGRFNPRGIPALYAALVPKTAWMEAQQGMPFKAQPLTLVGYRVDCERVVDLADPTVAKAVGTARETLFCPWEDLTNRGMTPPTWALAEALIDAGVHGVLVPSYAPGTGPSNRNLVLWSWSDDRPCHVEIIDDIGRLPKNDASWR